MTANPKQLRDTLRLTRDFLDVRSESDLEGALEWLGKITGCDSILAVNFQCGTNTLNLQTNAVYHKSKLQTKCDQQEIIDNPLFNLVKQSFEVKEEQSHLCLPPCGGVGSFMGEKNTTTDSITSLLLVTSEKNTLQAGHEISQFLLPHITSAIQRYLSTSENLNKPNTCALSTRELDVLNWVSLGKSNWETAVILGISENTVKFHMSNICKKLNVRKRGHAIAVATQLNLINI